MQDLFRRETGETYDERLVEDLIRACVQGVMHRLSEDLLDIFTSPARREYQELAALLEEGGSLAKAAVEVEEMVHLAEQFGDESVFDGFRPFSLNKMAAMIGYLIANAKFVSKTSLNKYCSTVTSHISSFSIEAGPARFITTARTNRLPMRPSLSLTK